MGTAGAGKQAWRKGREMIIRQREDSAPFRTRDGSVIRSLLDRSNAPVSNQSLAEATLGPGDRTIPHSHAVAEEFYYVVEGQGAMRIGEEECAVIRGDAILIPPGALHSLSNTGDSYLRILCCCSPPYSHEDTHLQ
jgi:mannose-6-phosphate isomerase-like protein (cupin superfamily)